MNDVTHEITILKPLTPHKYFIPSSLKREPYKQRSPQIFTCLIIQKRVKFSMKRGEDSSNSRPNLKKVLGAYLFA